MSAVVSTAATMCRQVNSVDRMFDRMFDQVLDLCSEDELEAVHVVLHGPSLFSPLVKSLVTESEPPMIHLRGRVGSWWLMAVGGWLTCMDVSGSNQGCGVCPCRQV